MKSKSNPSYLYQSRHGIYYFRVRIPLIIKSRYNTSKNEIRRSLNTSNIVVARREARRLWVHMEDTEYTMNNDELERQIQESNEGRQLLKQFLIAQIKSRETGILEGEDVDSYFVDDEYTENETSIFFRKLSSHQEDLLKTQLDSWGDEPEDKKKAILLKLKNEIDKEEKEDIVPIKNTTLENEDTHDHSTDTKSDLFISDAVKLFVEDGIKHKSKGDAKGWAKSTIESYNGILKEFIRIIAGDEVRCSELNEDLIRFYDDNIWLLPISFTKKNIYKKMSVDEAIQYVQNNKTKTKSNETIKNHIMRVRELLEWLEKQRYTKEVGLEKYLNEVPASTIIDENKRDAFEDDELNKLFNNEIYEKGQYSYGASRYWLPLISLFTGMRGEEIAQLYSDDVQYDDKNKVWFIEVRFNEERLQSNKTNNSPRKIPIHPKLNKLGLIDYAKSFTKASMLFPECYNENGNHYKRWGNNFNRKSKSGWKWKLGVTREGAVFHSFRHNFSQSIELKGVEEKFICALLGQNYSGELVPNYRVNKDKILNILNGYVKLVEYHSIDWSKIEKRRKW